MVRALVIIMIATFVLALGCFGGVVGLGGPDLARNGWVWPEKWRQYGIHVDSDGDISTESDETRELTWAGGPSLQLDLPAEVVFTQGSETKVVVSGPKSVIDRIAFEGDRLHFADDSARQLREGLTITITAPSVKRFVVNGASRLTIDAYDQPELAVEINGSGDVVASGKAGKVSISVAGSGKADLGGVETRDAAIDIAGSGDATASPTGAAKVSIAGSGDVNLLSKPASLEKDVAGSGDVHVDE